MENDEYRIAYKEVLEILNFISKEEYQKVPQTKIKIMKENAAKEYDFNYNPSKTLDEQNVSKIAKCIIAIFFRDYWATPEQRKIIVDYQNLVRKKNN